MLLLGWTGCALIAGALPWRPHVWVTGSSATGKSTLQKALEHLLDGGALHTQDATEAALRQLLKQQTLPVLFDELEANEDNRRARR
jgi:adenylylsulfate kinase-like enzyme